jgi:hypothetical protein
MTTFPAFCIFDMSDIFLFHFTSRACSTITKIALSVLLSHLTIRLLLLAYYGDSRSYNSRHDTDFHNEKHYNNPDTRTLLPIQFICLILIDLEFSSRSKKHGFDWHDEDFDSFLCLDGGGEEEEE